MYKLRFDDDGCFCVAQGQIGQSAKKITDIKKQWGNDILAVELEDRWVKNN